MSLSKAFKKHMTELTTTLTTAADVNKETNTINYDVSKLTFPKGITGDSLELHVGYINEVSAASEAATATLAQQMFKDNKDLTTVDSTLNICNGLTIRGQHHLKQSLGNDTFLYGESTTMVDFVGTEDQAKWLNETREHNKALAKALFK